MIGSDNAIASCQRLGSCRQMIASRRDRCGVRIGATLLQETLIFPYLTGGNSCAGSSRRAGQYRTTDADVDRTVGIRNDISRAATPTTVVLPALVRHGRLPNNSGIRDGILLYEYLKEQPRRAWRGRVDGDRYMLINTPRGDAIAG